MNQKESPLVSINLKESLRVSVIICCYTEERLKDIHEAVESVLAQTLRPHEVIIAVDHNKELYQKLAETYRDSVEISRNFVNTTQSPNLQSPIPILLILNEGAQGVSETRSLGIRIADSKFIACIDDDAIAEKEWLEKLIEHLPNPNVMVIGGKVILRWPAGKRPGWFPEELDWIIGGTYRGLPLQGKEVRNVSSCNMASTSDIFKAIDYFNPNIGSVAGKRRGAEEAELCLRLKQKIPQAMIWYQPEAIVHHKVPPQRLTLRYLISRSYQEGFSKAKVQKLLQPTQQTSSTQQILSTENAYLRYLLSKSIPERLTRFYHRESLPQIVAIIMCVAATGLGYLVGRAIGRSHITII